MKTLIKSLIIANLIVIKVNAQSENPCKVTLTANHKTPLCTGDKVTLNASYHPNASYIWLMNNNPIKGSADTPTFETYAGSMFSVIMINDSLKCQDTSEAIPLVFNPTPITYPTIYGSIEVLMYSAQEYFVPSYYGLYYHWSSKNATTLNNIPANYFTVKWDSLGLMEVCLTVSNTFGCFSDTTRRTITVSDNNIYLLADTIYLSNRLPSQKFIGVFSKGPWDVIENIPWLEVDKKLGDKIEDVKINAVEQNFGANRSGKIFFRSFNKIDSLTVIQGLATGLSDLEESDYITVYPNPSSGSFILNNQSTNDYLVTVYNSFGQTAIPKFEVAADSETLIKENLGPGIYHIEIQTHKTKRQIKLIVSK